VKEAGFEVNAVLSSLGVCIHFIEDLGGYRYAGAAIFV
jgi:hypothetical protein